MSYRLLKPRVDPWKAVRRGAARGEVRWQIRANGGRQWTRLPATSHREPSSPRCYHRLEMAKFKLRKSKSKSSAVPPAGLPCVILILSAIALVFLFLFFVLKYANG